MDLILTLLVGCFAWDFALVVVIVRRTKSVHLIEGMHETLVGISRHVGHGEAERELLLLKLGIVESTIADLLAGQRTTQEGHAAINSRVEEIRTLVYDLHQKLVEELVRVERVESYLHGRRRATEEAADASSLA